MIVNVFGPPMSGKTTNAEDLRKLYGLTHVVDDGRLDADQDSACARYLISYPIKDSTLVITHRPRSLFIAKFNKHHVTSIPIGAALADLARGKSRLARTQQGENGNGQ